jgi:Na+-translocating ferredoxin:NAD+ oxidoreductase RnfC subunit
MSLPDDLPDIIPIPFPARLWIPLGSGGTSAKPKPPGTIIGRGRPVAEKAAESSHIPLAPADGVLGIVRPIRLTNSRPASAVELIVSTNATPPEISNLKSSFIDTPPLTPSPGTPGEGRGEGLLHSLEQIRAAGVWADRHISPDLIGQLNQLIARPVDTLICTILDTDATLPLSAVIAARDPDLLVHGVSFLARMAGARRAILAVEMFAQAPWVDRLRAAASRANLEVAEVPNQYPQSDPTLMIYTLTTRRLRQPNLPTTAAVLVIDAAAALAVANATAGQAMLRVLIGVHDHYRRISRICDAPVGVTVQHVLESLGIHTDEANVRGGDLLRDLRLRTDAVISGGELAIHVTGPEIPVVPDHCIRCAWCLEACPTLVHPGLVLDAVQRNDPKMAQRAGVAACIECGLCSHVCPSRLPLLSVIRDYRASKFD